MDTIRCPQCRQRVSELEDNCPECGFGVFSYIADQKEKNTRNRLLVGAFFAAVALYLLFHCLMYVEELWKEKEAREAEEERISQLRDDPHIQLASVEDSLVQGDLDEARRKFEPLQEALPEDERVQRLEEKFEVYRRYSRAEEYLAEGKSHLDDGEIVQADEAFAEGVKLLEPLDEESRDPEYEWLPLALHDQRRDTKDEASRIREERRKAAKRAERRRKEKERKRQAFLDRCGEKPSISVAAANYLLQNLNVPGSLRNLRCTDPAPMEDNALDLCWRSTCEFFAQNRYGVEVRSSGRFFAKSTKSGETILQHASVD